MLSRQNRLSNKKDFEAVCRWGTFFAFGNVSLKVKKNDRGCTRIGISVGLKFSSKAVERNRAKRQLREAAQEYLGKMAPGWDMVIMVGKSPKKMDDPEALKQNFIKALSKANLIINQNPI